MTEHNGTERDQPRTAQSFCVPKTEIAAAGYDLALNRYKESDHIAQEHATPAAIICELRQIEEDIFADLVKLEEMLG